MYASCEKNPPKVCNVENPHLNIDWLKLKIEQNKNASIPTKVYSFIFNKNDHFLIIKEGFGFTIYNCCGSVLCYEGDVSGNCSDEILAATIVKTLIYESNK